MPEPQPDQNLHLPSLVIKNFRGIDELTIPRLGRVTLLAGKNGVGKTTVLDAVRIWADRGVNGVFDTVLRDRGDAFTSIQADAMVVAPDRYALFTNRSLSLDSAISIGPGGDNTLRIQLGSLVTGLEPSTLPSSLVPENVQLTTRFITDMSKPDVIRIPDDFEQKPVICNTLSPNGPTDETVERYWSEVALTTQEDRALEALNLITDAEVERVAALGPPVSSGITQPRRMMAKVTGRDYQVPLRTLGDGAMRTYAIALALVKSSNGFLLIDEAENGIHHSIQPKFWKMVLQTAQRNNVQVLATTHSGDCVKGFAQAANELEDVEGLLVRLERVPIGLQAITYDESRLAIAARSNIEVR